MLYPCTFGAKYSKEKTNFTLWAPESESVTLRTYNAGSVMLQEDASSEYLMEKGEDGVFSLDVSGDLHGIYYDFILKDKDGQCKRSADPWAVACGVNGRRSMVVDLKNTDPGGWAEDERVDVRCAPVIWEAHISDFSFSQRSGIPEKWRGKYLAFTILNSTLDGNGEFPTCVNHLKKMGITHVQLQPIADFCTVDESRDGDYNWGYDIGNYNCPEGSYSTDPFHGEVRIKECKQMIQALHKAGIGVILDVVYNHTYYSKNSYFHRCAPGRYYRYAADGSFMNASGCGSETASEKEPFRNYMIQSILYWAREYHVDGFRFDLMGIHDVETMKLIRQALDELPEGEKILMYGEPWGCLETALKEPDLPANKENSKLLPERVGIFRDDIRNTLVGAVSNPYDPGYAAGAVKPCYLEAIKKSVRGGYEADGSGDTNSPMQAVSYVSCHDNNTLWDRLVIQNDSYAFEGKDDGALQKVKFTSGIYLTCEGRGFMLAGEEFCRTKHGDGNSYKGPAYHNQLNWERTQSREDMIEWYKGIISIRKEMITLSKEDADSIVFHEYENSQALSFERKAHPQSIWDRFFVIYNPEGEREFDFPSGSWTLLCDGSLSSICRELKIEEGKDHIVYKAPAFSVIIAAGTDS